MVSPNFPPPVLDAPEQIPDDIRELYDGVGATPALDEYGQPIGVVAEGALTESALPVPEIPTAERVDLVTPDTQITAPIAEVPQYRSNIDDIEIAQNDVDTQSGDTYDVLDTKDEELRGLGVGNIAEAEEIIEAFESNPDEAANRYKGNPLKLAAAAMRYRKAERTINTRWDESRKQQLVTEREKAQDSAAKLVEEKRLREYELERSKRDTLTGALNRGGYDDLLHGLFERSRQPDQSKGITLINVDLLNFKLANDTFGHHVGDAILRATKRTLETVVVRDSDEGRVIRDGGDEWKVLYLKELKPEDQKGFCDRLDKMQQVLVGVGDDPKAENFDSASYLRDPNSYASKMLHACTVLAEVVDEAKKANPDVKGKALTEVIPIKRNDGTEDEDLWVTAKGRQLIKVDDMVVFGFSMCSTAELKDLPEGVEPFSRAGFQVQERTTDAGIEVYKEMMYKKVGGKYRTA